MTSLFLKTYSTNQCAPSCCCCSRSRFDKRLLAPPDKSTLPLPPAAAAAAAAAAAPLILPVDKRRSRATRTGSSTPSVSSISSALSALSEVRVLFLMSQLRTKEQILSMAEQAIVEQEESWPSNGTLSPTALKMYSRTGCGMLG